MASADSSGWGHIRRQARDPKVVVWTLGVFTAGLATGVAIHLLTNGSDHDDAGSAWLEIGLALAVIVVALGAQVLINRTSGRRWVKHRPRVRTRVRRMRPSVRRPKVDQAGRLRRR